MTLVPPVPRDLRGRNDFEFCERVRRNLNDLTSGYVLTRSSTASSATPITLGIDDYVVIITGSTAQTINLPVAIDGKAYVIKSRSTANVTVTPNGTDTIDGVSASIVMVKNQVLRLICSGVDWVIL